MKTRVLARISRSDSLRLLIEAALSFLVWALVLVASDITPNSVRSDKKSWALTMFAVLVTTGLLARGRVHTSRPSLPYTDEIAQVLSSVLGGSVSLAVVSAFTDWHLGATELLIGSAALIVVRSMAWGVLRDLFERSSRFRRSSSVIVIGVGPEAGQVCQLILDHPERNVTLVGLVGNRVVAERYGLGPFWIGDTPDLINLMEDRQANTAILTPTGFRSEQFDHLTQTLQSAGHDVHLSTGITRLKQGRITTTSLAHEPLLVLRNREISHFARAVKRAFDIVGALILLVIASPLMVLIAVAIKLDSRGPVFYPSPRFGRGVEAFPMWKFRSMVNGADATKNQLTNDRTGPIFKVANDPRVTRVGRFIRETSLDEIPQFFNVLKGDMSLVGPRPALPAEEAAFEGEHRDRFVVRPGITGLWQVEARANASFGAYERLDLHYLENWSLALDLAILLATAEQVAVTLCTFPIRKLIRAEAVDGVDTSAQIDLRGEFDIRPAGQPAPAAPADIS